MIQPPARRRPARRAASPENALLLREGAKIVQALGRMLAPSCEVVLHDLEHPENAILAIENPLSGRAVGEPTTEMGLARVYDASFPDVVQNYANTFPDGRPVKSTSIGLRNSEGVCVAAICLNLDLSMFGAMQLVLEQLSRVDVPEPGVQESFRSRTLEEVRDMVRRFASERNTTPRALPMRHRRELVHLLSEKGLLQIRGAIGAVSEALGIARASVYNALKAERPGATD